MRGIVLRPRDWLGLLLLAYLAGEAHEIAHLSVGRLACGQWVGVSFSVVQWPQGCPDNTPLALASTAAGPVFTFLLIWVGVALAARPRWTRAAYLLILANLPFARLFTALTGHGDEVVVGRALAGSAGVIAATLIVALLAVPPMIVVWRQSRSDHRLLQTVGGLLGVMLAQGLVTMLILDRALPHLPSATLAGIPIVVWSVNAAVLALYTAGRFYRSNDQPPGTIAPEGRSRQLIADSR